TNYSFVAQVTDSGGLVSNQAPISATTTSVACPTPSLSASASNITTNSALLTGSAISGGNNISHFIGWYTPTTARSPVATGATLQLNGLAAQTAYTYYARVTNTCGLSAGPTPVTFTTSCSAPTLTASASNVTTTSALLTGTAMSGSTNISGSIGWYNS